MRLKTTAYESTTKLPRPGSSAKEVRIDSTHGSPRPQANLGPGHRRPAAGTTWNIGERGRGAASHVVAQGVLHGTLGGHQDVAPCGCDELRQGLRVEAAGPEPQAAVHAVGRQLQRQLLRVVLLLLHLRHPPTLPAPTRCSCPTPISCNNISSNHGRLLNPSATAVTPFQGWHAPAPYSRLCLGVHHEGFLWHKQRALILEFRIARATGANRQTLHSPERAAEGMANWMQHVTTWCG